MTLPTYGNALTQFHYLGYKTGQLNDNPQPQTITKQDLAIKFQHKLSILEHFWTIWFTDYIRNL